MMINVRDGQVDVRAELCQSASKLQARRWQLIEPLNVKASKRSSGTFSPVKETFCRITAAYGTMRGSRQCDCSGECVHQGIIRFAVFWC